MADINLEVAAKSTGVNQVIAELENMRSAGLRTGETLTALGRRTEEMMRRVKTAMSSGIGTRARPFTAAEDAVNSLTASLRAQREEYQRQAVLNLGTTPAQRLIAYGGGGIRAGMNRAAREQAEAEAMAATAIGDKMAVERADMQLQQSRTSAINAQKQVAVARWERELAAMTPVEAASARLTRATQELAVSTRLMNLADDQVARNPVAASYDRQAQAAIRQAAAVRGLTAAQNEFTVAQDRARIAQEAEAKANGSGKFGGDNAFQSSFSYFIIAGLAQQAAQALRDFGVASVGAAATLERSFADVDRTFDGTDQQLESLRLRLLDLSTRTPISFSDLAEIAALGNQLGIASQDIQSFTTTISQYSAISGQTAEDSATAFGKISNLTGLAASQYSNLASSILYTARTSVATEATISRTAQEITALASGAGFSAQAIVGLSGALSSLSIPPERARGALSLYFGALNNAVAEGGPKLEAFATLVGKSQQQISELVHENRGQEIFTAFISGLSKLDSVAKTTALDTLGLSTIRVDQTMRALSQNVPLLTSSLSGADKAFKDNTETSRQYAVIQDTMASKFVEFQNIVQNAAAALGGDFNGAVVHILGAVSQLILGFTAFANTPFGRTVLFIAGAVGALVFVLSSVVGVMALAKASLVVVNFAFRGMAEGLSSASPALERFLAGMFRMNIANTTTAASSNAAAASTTVLSSRVKEGAVAAGAGAAGNTALAASEEAVGAGGKAAALGLRTMKFALAGTGIGLGIVLIGSLLGALSQTAEQAKLTAGDVTGLGDAVTADTKHFQSTGDAIATYTAKLPQASDDQKRVDQSARNLAKTLGIDIPSGAGKAKKALQEIAAGGKTVDEFKKALGEKAKDIIGDTNFASAWGELGLNMDKAIAGGLRGHGNESAVRKALLGQIKGLKEDTFFPPGSMFPVTFFKDAEGHDITDQVNQILRLVPSLTSVGTAMQETANANSIMNGELDETGKKVAETATGFMGAVDGIGAYRDAIQKGMQGFTNFKDILKGIQDAQDEANKRKGPDATDTSLINATAFGRDLSRANEQAVKFFQGIQTLAAGGASSFATQLAELGPDAQLILADALKLDGPAKAELEANARFAAFLASDEFKAALQQSMSVDNAAYAQIFKATGSIDAVRDFIAKQVAGAGEQAEREWDALHPEFPLNITPSLVNPTPDELDLYKREVEGRLTITPSVIFADSHAISEQVKIYQDKVSGASITLPANLDGAALTQSLFYWNQHQNSTPQQIAAALNTNGFSAALDAWRRAHGPVIIPALILPSGNLGVDRNGRPVNRGLFSDGGQVNVPHFANGGAWGPISGPGSGTSDSIWAKVSNGEFINTADATRFWGPDFFDSLNRKMLPTNFLNLLGAAMVSGNHGPTHVANVNVIQNNPLTRDPLKQLREDSEMLSEGIWG